MTTPRITFVTTSLMLGGAENQVALLAERMSHDGLPTQVISLRTPTAHTSRLRRAGVPVISLKMEHKSQRALAPIRLTRALRAFQTDVAHAHMVHANILVRATRPLHRTPRVITTAHAIYEGGRILDAAYRATDRFSDLTTHVCSQGLRRMMHDGLCPSARAAVVPNAVDVTELRSHRASGQALRRALNPHHRFVWLTVTRLEPPKDLATLLRAFARLPGDDELWVVGDGFERARHERAVQTQVRDPSRVRFLGHRDDVADLMWAADAFVLSSHQEALPMTLLEASAVGLPCLASDVGGVREALPPQPAGRAVPDRDVAAMVEAMKPIRHATPEARATMGAAAVRFVRDRFDVPQIARRWQQWYLTPAPSAFRHEVAA